MSQMMRIDGEKMVSRMLKELDQNVRRNMLRAAGREAADVMVEEAQVLVRKRTGALRSAIKRALEPKESTAFSVAYSVGVAGGQQGDYFYWYFLEHGTSRMSAKPFLRPAFDNKQDEAVNAAGAVLRDRLRPYGLR